MSSHPSVLTWAIYIFYWVLSKTSQTRFSSLKASLPVALPLQLLQPTEPPSMLPPFTP